MTERREPGALVGALWTVRRAGTGRPLVLLHGNGGSHRVFDRLVTRLPGRDLVGLDSRGHGASPRGDGPLTIARMADDVAKTLRLLGLDDVDVLGYSDGGNIGLELALRHPGAVHRLLVCGSNLEPAGMTRGWYVATHVGHRVVTVLGRVLPGLRAVGERWALMAHDPHIAPQDLARVEIPVLVLVGEHDAIRPEHSRAMSEALPAGRLVVLPGAGHPIPTTRTDDLARLASGFFAADG